MWDSSKSRHITLHYKYIIPAPKKHIAVIIVYFCVITGLKISVNNY